MTQCYLGLGANLNEPYQQLEQCLNTLANHTDLQLLDYSDCYRSKPVGPQDQPDYVNAVARIETALAPEALLDALQQIENDQGRVRLRRWGERTLDIDILLYGDQHIHTERLTVPHIEMRNRLFVIQPLMDITTTLSFSDGSTIEQLYDQLKDQDQLVSMGRPKIVPAHNI